MNSSSHKRYRKNKNRAFRGIRGRGFSPQTIEMFEGLVIMVHGLVRDKYHLEKRVAALESRVEEMSVPKGLGAAVSKKLEEEIASLPKTRDEACKCPQLKYQDKPAFYLNGKWYCRQCGGINAGASMCQVREEREQVHGQSRPSPIIIEGLESASCNCLNECVCGAKNRIVATFKLPSRDDGWSLNKAQAWVDSKLRRSP